ncbi:hypothetical protein QT386_05420 [Solimonas sp. SE-A11]|nr:hypothetical protein [Solimonas sp. SE-A11]
MMSFRNLAGLLLGVALLHPAQDATAQVFKCKTPSGAIEFQAYPCTAGTSADGKGRNKINGPSCMGGDGEWYPYGDARCMPTASQGGSAANQQEEKAQAERYLRCLNVRGKPEKLPGTVFSTFRQLCDAEPEAQFAEKGPDGARTRWVFRSYDLDIYTQGDRIVDVRKQR